MINLIKSKSKKVYYFSIFFSLISCTNKISYISKDVTKEFSLDGLTNVSEILDSLDKSYKVDSLNFIYSALEKEFNFYDLHFYTKINDSLVVFYYDYDYEKAFLLVHLDIKKQRVISKTKLAYISGDGGDFSFKKSEFKDGVFYSSFISGLRNFTSPIETIKYANSGTSIIKILPSGKIQEDTIISKKDFKKNVGDNFNLEDSF